MGVRQYLDDDDQPLLTVGVKSGHWVTADIGPSTTATVAASALGLSAFAVGTSLIVESTGTLLLHAADSGWSENWTNNRTTNPLERAKGTTLVKLQSAGDTLFLRDEGITERGAPSKVTIALPVDIPL